MADYCDPDLDVNNGNKIRPKYFLIKAAAEKLRGRV